MKPPSPTAVPKVLAKLHGLALERFPDMTVTLGPTGGADTEDEHETLWIAPGDEAEPGVRVSLARDPGLRNQYTETAEIIINFLVQSGDEKTAMQSLLDRAGEVYAEFRTMLQDHPLLDDTCDQVSLGESADWHPMQTTAGASVGLGFVIVAKTVI